MQKFVSQFLKNQSQLFQYIVRKSPCAGTMQLAKISTITKYGLELKKKIKMLFLNFFLEVDFFLQKLTNRFFKVKLFFLLQNRLILTK